MELEARRKALGLDMGKEQGATALGTSVVPQESERDRRLRLRAEERARRLAGGGSTAYSQQPYAISTTGNQSFTPFHDTQQSQGRLPANVVDQRQYYRDESDQQQAERKPCKPIEAYSSPPQAFEPPSQAPETAFTYFPGQSEDQRHRDIEKKQEYAQELRDMTAAKTLEREKDPSFPENEQNDPSKLRKLQYKLELERQMEDQRRRKEAERKDLKEKAMQEEAKYLSEVSTTGERRTGKKVSDPNRPYNADLGYKRQGDVEERMVGVAVKPPKAPLASADIKKETYEVISPRKETILPYREVKPVAGMEGNREIGGEVSEVMEEILAIRKERDQAKAEMMELREMRLKEKESHLENLMRMMAVPALPPAAALPNPWGYPPYPQSYQQPPPQSYQQPPSQPLPQPYPQPYPQPPSQSLSQSYQQPYPQPYQQPYAQPSTQAYAQSIPRSYAPVLPQPYPQSNTQPQAYVQPSSHPSKPPSARPANPSSQQYFSPTSDSTRQRPSPPFQTSEKLESPKALIPTKSQKERCTVPKEVPIVHRKDATDFFEQSLAASSKFVVPESMQWGTTKLLASVQRLPEPQAPSKPWAAALKSNTLKTEEMEESLPSTVEHIPVVAVKTEAIEEEIEGEDWEPSSVSTPLAPPLLHLQSEEAVSPIEHPPLPDSPQTDLSRFTENDPVSVKSSAVNPPIQPTRSREKEAEAVLMHNTPRGEASPFVLPQPGPRSTSASRSRPKTLDVFKAVKGPQKRPENGPKPPPANTTPKANLSTLQAQRKQEKLSESPYTSQESSTSRGLKDYQFSDSQPRPVSKGSRRYTEFPLDFD